MSFDSETIRAQAEEIRTLRAEVERLRVVARLLIEYDEMGDADDASDVDMMLKYAAAIDAARGVKS
jgi:hypothetical protein